MKNKIVIAALVAAGIVFAHQAFSLQNAAAQTVSDHDLQLLRKDLRSQKKQIVAANLN